jgi:hypothetical protein
MPNKKASNSIIPVITFWRINVWFPRFSDF